MNAKERGFLLLTSQLGDPDRKPMSVSQFRNLASRVTQMRTTDTSRELTAEDLVALGYDRVAAQRIINLLAGERGLDAYLHLGKQYSCVPISRVNAYYPGAVRQRLGLDAPGCLWAKGDISLLSTKKIALVGSRDLSEPNCLFAEAVGYAAAHQGITLVSGNARGADRAAQRACLDAGGKVISVVADELYKHPLQENVLYLSEDGFDLRFSSQRALSRNRVIHTLGSLTFVAQCRLEQGGTWYGTVKNLQNSWSPVFCFDDSSEAMLEMERLGASLITTEELADLSGLQSSVIGLF